MKKLFALSLIAILSLISLTAKAGDYPNGNLTDIINGATDGEVINLTGTAYTYSVRASALTKSLTIQAGPAVTARPVITVGQAGVQFIATGATAQTLVLKGLEFNGSAIATGLTHGKNAAGGNFTVTVDNCKTTNFSVASGSYMFQYAATTGLAVYGDLTVSNSELMGTGLVVLNTTATNLSPNNISFSNCLISGFNTGNVTISVQAVTALNSISFDHCTFINGPTSSRRPLSLPATTPQVVKNCIFVDQPGTGNNTVAANVDNVNNIIFNAGLVARWTNIGALSLVNPAVGANGVTTEATFINAGSDSKTIGFYGAPAFTTSVPKSVKANKLTISQTGTNFKINGIADAAYTVYSVGGSQVATGVIVDGNFQMTANKGIYILKSNGQVAKFAVR